MHIVKREEVIKRSVSHKIAISFIKNRQKRKSEFGFTAPHDYTANNTNFQKPDARHFDAPVIEALDPYLEGTNCFQNLLQL